MGADLHSGSWISVDEAINRVLAATGTFPATEAPLTAALGHFLAQDATSDIAMPPFDRSAVDGFAVRAQDVTQPPVELEIIEDIPAGKAPEKTVGARTCASIMTGAPVPAGADAVVMVERTSRTQDSRVRIEKSVDPGQNVCLLGEDVQVGDVVLAAGSEIRASEAGILASAGVAQVPVRRGPVIRVLPTGDELVEPDQTPGPGQIRNSNSYSLLGQIATTPAAGRYGGIVPDDPDKTERAIREALASADIVIFTGGVSMGELDFVGRTLADCGVEILFEKVAVKPGKPTVFGVMPQAEGPAKLVFGLPGNPVATVVGFLLFVRTAIRKMMGARVPEPRFLRLPAAQAVAPGRDRRLFHPARLVDRNGHTAVETVTWHGSAHLAALAECDGFLVVPEGAPETPADGIVTFLPLG